MNDTAHQGGMCGINEGRCEDCEREVRLKATAAHARGDWVAERKALDVLALMERGQLSLVQKLAKIDDAVQAAHAAHGIIGGPTPNQLARAAADELTAVTEELGLYDSGNLTYRNGDSVFTVTTASGFEMILEDAGRDGAGNQLWRQIKLGIGPDWKRQERENVQRLKLVDP